MITNKKIEKLEIIFENNESYTLNFDEIENCLLYNLHRNIQINENGKDGGVYDFTDCDEVIIYINQKGLKSNTSSLDGTLTLEERVSYKDITHLALHYDNDTSEYVSVYWPINSEKENSSQNNLYFEDADKNEVLAIIIKKGLVIGELEEYGIE